MIFLYLYNTHIDIIIEDEIKSLPLEHISVISLAPAIQYHGLQSVSISFVTC